MQPMGFAGKHNHGISFYFFSLVITLCKCIDVYLCLPNVFNEFNHTFILIASGVVQYICMYISLPQLEYTRFCFFPSHVETLVTFCPTMLMLLRTLSYWKWSCGMLVSHSACGWWLGHNKSHGWSRLMEAGWSFKSLYSQGSFLLVRACQLLPIALQISPCACLFVRIFVCHCSFLCIPFTHSLLLLLFLLLRDDASLSPFSLVPSLTHSFVEFLPNIANVYLQDSAKSVCTGLFLHGY